VRDVSSKPAPLNSEDAAPGASQSRVSDASDVLANADWEKTKRKEGLTCFFLLPVYNAPGDLQQDAGGAVESRFRPEVLAEAKPSQWEEATCKHRANMQW
jgi:hypothetical protein